MKIYDKVKKVDVEISDYKELIQIMKDGRQVDLYLKEKTSDDMRVVPVHAMEHLCGSAYLIHDFETIIGG